MRIAFIAAVVLGAFAVGCSATPSNATPTGGAGASGGDAGGAPKGNALTCGAIFECVAACPTSDNSTCEDACVARGTPNAKTAVGNIVKCFEKNECQDAACFQANCTTELAACVKPESTGEPLVGAAPAGNIPANLVGNWYSFGELWEFKSDGSVIHGFNAKTSGCSSSSQAKGTAVASGTTLTVYYTSGATSLCGGAPSDPFGANSKGYTYSVDSGGLVLHLTELDCSYKDPAAAAQYCAFGFDKVD